MAHYTAQNIDPMVKGRVFGAAVKGRMVGLTDKTVCKGNWGQESKHRGALADALRPAFHEVIELGHELFRPDFLVRTAGMARLSQQVSLVMDHEPHYYAIQLKTSRSGRWKILGQQERLSQQQRLCWYTGMIIILHDVTQPGQWVVFCLEDLSGQSSKSRIVHKTRDGAFLDQPARVRELMQRDTLLRVSKSAWCTNKRTRPEGSSVSAEESRA